MRLSLFIVIGLIVLSCSEKKKDSSSILDISDKELKKVLFVNSYHAELPWSKGIIKGAMDFFGVHFNPDGTLDMSRSKVNLKIVHMDTKRNKSEAYKKKAALKVKETIEKWKPDAVIAADDNASKYLIQPYYKNSDIPFVFCGVNWDHKVYGYPYKNVTGMVEVQLIPELVTFLSSFSNGKRVGYLKGDSLSSRREAEFFEKALGRKIKRTFVNDLKSWKVSFKKLQKQVDILLLGNFGALNNINAAALDELKKFVTNNTKIPTGAWDSWMGKFALVTFSTRPQEQGSWSASTVMKILNGVAVPRIKIVKNKEMGSYLNMSIARELSVKFKIDIVERSELVN